MPRAPIEREASYDAVGEMNWLLIARGGAVMALTAFLSACGHHSIGATGSDQTSAGLKNIGVPATGGSTFRATPFSLACVMSSFARAGTPMNDTFGEATAARVGVATLSPVSDGIGVGVAVQESVADARRTFFSWDYVVRHHPTKPGAVIVRNENVVISYPRRPGERLRVMRAIAELKSRCG